MCLPEQGATEEEPEMAKGLLTQAL
jgi:hypothetical protein